MTVGVDGFAPYLGVLGSGVFDLRLLPRIAAPSRRVMWVTRAMPSTTPRQVTSHGRSPTPCIRAARQAGQGAVGVVRMDDGERAAVSGVEGLQQVGRFGAAHFAEDDVIGPLPQGVAHEVADCERSLL